MLSTQRDILIDDKGTPLLCDFGRSKLIDHRGFTTLFAGSARYMAPELTATESDVDFEFASESFPILTKATDVFAFSMVALEVSDMFHV
jgi:serine/threonine protein kinase